MDYIPYVIPCSTHSWLEMSQKEVWAKEYCPTCSFPHEVPENSAQCLNCPSQGTFLYPAQVPVLCHIGPNLSWHLFLQRQGLQPAYNQKPPALSHSFRGSIDCPAILACQSFDWGPCSCLLQPSQTLLWLQDVQSKVYWADWVKAARPVLSPCSQHATTAFLCAAGAEFGACTEQGGFWYRNMLGPAQCMWNDT